MKESKLIKQWKESDVQRMRNIITKNYNDKTNAQIGYTKIHEEHKENDVWEENGKKWTIKNGIKVNITKLDVVKKILQLPLTCPNCNKLMNKGKLDKIMYQIHKKCSDCVIENETKLKVNGTFDEYQQTMLKKDIEYHIKEMEDILLEISLENNNESFITENGDIEVWKGNGLDKEKIQEEIKTYIGLLKSM